MATLKEIYKTAIEVGILNDPRGVSAVEDLLKKEAKKYAELSPAEKEGYDVESLTNPYSDSRILNGSGELEVKSVLAGIDIESPEILLASNLRNAGKKIDLVVSHHPEGRAYAKFYEVMEMQSDILNKMAGVPINVAESLLSDRKGEVSRRVAPANHTRAVDAAKLLDIAFMCLHTPSDNMATTYLSKLFDEKKPETLGDILDLLSEIPEYGIAKKESVAPFVLIGDKSKKAGKIFVDMTGGTEGSKEIFSSFKTAGVGTIVGMHMSEEHYKKAKENHINVVIAGHISSDNLGLNLLLDEIEKKLGTLEIISCSGFRRIKHT